ncbi:MAG: ORF6N domain-containing protein [Endomicrobiia bacterium]|nr:ORF6N domain-containing protein [Endomicrobiia bacterium]
MMDDEGLSVELVQRRIFVIRGVKIMLDSDLALLYGVPTKSLNLAVKRNIERFPPDFMFRLTAGEAESLGFQIGTSNVRADVFSEPSGRLGSGKIADPSLRFQNETSNISARGGRRYLPFAFTEQGVAMLSGVLRSKRAVEINILIMRAFVALRRFLASHEALSKKMTEMEKIVSANRREIISIWEVIKQLMTPASETPKKIGFVKGE